MRETQREETLRLNREKNERIRALEASLREWRETAEQREEFRKKAHDRAEKLEAEREKMREAHVHIIIERDALKARVAEALRFIEDDGRGLRDDRLALYNILKGGGRESGGPDAGADRASAGGKKDFSDGTVRKDGTTAMSITAVEPAAHPREVEPGTPPGTLRTKWNIYPEDKEEC